MAEKRKQYSNDFKFKVALAAIKGVKTISQLGSDYNLHPNHRQGQEQATKETELYEQIGRLKIIMPFGYGIRVVEKNYPLRLT